MPEVTIKSNEARNHWGELLNTASAGGRVVIRRRNKPRVVLVSHAHWEKLQQRLKVLEIWAEARKAKEEYEAGKTSLVTWEELTRLAEARYGVGA